MVIIVFEMNTFDVLKLNRQFLNTNGFSLAKTIFIQHDNFLFIICKMYLII